MDKIIIQVQFQIEQDGFVFRDALNFDQAEYEALSSKELEVMKQARFDNWKAFAAMQSKVEPTKEQLEANIAALNEQEAEYQSKLDKINAK